MNDTTEEVVVKKKKLNINSIIIFILGIMFGLTMLFSLEIFIDSKDTESEYDRLEKMMNEIKHDYDITYIGESIDTDKMLEVALDGFVAGVGDKYGTYLSPTEISDYYDKMYSTSVGIGVSVAYEETDDFKGLYITDVYKGSSAEKAGISVGDYITSVNDSTLYDISYIDFINSVKGGVGTKVKIETLSNDAVKTYMITRNNYSLQTVKYSIDNGIGYVKISNFESTTYTEFKNAIEELKKAGINKYIFDVRNNSGGLVDSITEVLDYMLPEGLIVKIVDKYNKENIFNSDSNELTGEMIILTNENTASAAELFTLSLRDYGKAISIGEKTFGKGTQVSTLPLSNGGGLILSSGLYYTKSNTLVENVGITPDISVKMSDEHKEILYKLPLSEDEQYQEAVKYLNN